MSKPIDVELEKNAVQLVSAGSYVSALLDWYELLYNLHNSPARQLQEHYKTVVGF